jgi:parallel beta-helix repeat protein
MSSSDIIVNQSIFFDNLGGITLEGKCVGCIISNNTFYDEQKVPTQKFAIKSDKKVSSCIVEPNIIRL